MRKIFAWGMAHGAWCITVRVSEHALAHYGAMPHDLCPMQKPYTALSVGVDCLPGWHQFPEKRQVLAGDHRFAVLFQDGAAGRPAESSGQRRIIQ